jgi:hypothetical protein
VKDDPSVAFATGPNQFTVSGPIRLSTNRQASVPDLQSGKHDATAPANGGGRSRDGGI